MCKLNSEKENRCTHGKKENTFEAWENMFEAWEKKCEQKLEVGEERRK